MVRRSASGMAARCAGPTKRIPFRVITSRLQRRGGIGLCFARWKNNKFVNPRVSATTPAGFQNCLTRKVVM